MGIAARLRAVRDEIARHCGSHGRDPGAVELLPISKKQDLAKVREAHELGCDVFGENRVQDLLPRAKELEDLEISWDMVGSLQTNKVNQLLRLQNLRYLHSLDREKLATALQTSLSREKDRELDCLLQIDATGEAAKHGCPPREAAALLEHVQGHCPRLRVVGLMAMGPLAGDPAPVFDRVAKLRKDLAEQSGLPLPVLSLGMTGDLEAAIAAGSTLVRVGTGVFGPRPG